MMENPVVEEPTDENTVNENSAVENKLSENLATENTVRENPAAENAVPKYMTAEDRAAENMPSENKAAGDSAAENMITENPTAEDIFTEKTVAENMLTEKLAAEDSTAGNMVSENPAAENMISENSDTENMVSENSTAEEISTENIVAEYLAAENMVSENPSAEDIFTENTVAEYLATENMVAEYLAAEDRAAENMVNENPVAAEIFIENTITDNMVAEYLAAENMVNVNPAAVHIFTENMIAEYLAGKDPTAENMVTENFAVENMVSENLSVEDSTAENMVSENSTTENMFIENTVVENMVAEDQTAGNMVTENLSTEDAAENMVNENTVAAEIFIENTITENMVAEYLAAENMVNENPAVENIFNENTVAENMVAEYLAVENMVSENSTAEDIFTENIVAEYLAAENRAAQNMVSGNLVVEEIFAENMVAEYLAAENMVNENPTTEELFTEITVAEYLSVEVSAPENMVTENLATEDPAAEDMFTENSAAENMVSNNPTNATMPLQIKRNCQLILYDLNTSDQELTKRCLLKYYCRKMFTNNEDLFKLILMNSKTTTNRLYSNCKDSYFGIWETMDRPASYSDPQWIDETIENAKIGDSDWLEAIYVAVKSLIEDFNENGVLVTLQLIFLTDFIKLKQTKRHNLLPEILNEFKDRRILLYIIGTDTTQSSQIKDFYSMQHWMYDFTLTSEANETNFDCLKNLIRRLLNRSICCNYQIGLNLVDSFKIYKGNEIWNTPLIFDDQLQFACSVNSVLKEEMLCKLTKKTIWVDAEDESIKYEPGDIIRGIERLDKFIPMMDDEAFKHETVREFVIIGFCKCNNLPEHYVGGKGTHYVLPCGTESEQDLMSLFIECLLGNDTCIIARRVDFDNDEAKFVVIIPTADETSKCLLLSDLPYRHQTFPHHIEEQIDRRSTVYRNATKNDIIYKFLDSIHYNAKNITDNFPLRIDKIQDPNSERIINKAADKLFGKDLRLDELDLNYLDVDIYDNPALDELKLIWPEREFNIPTETDENSEDD